MAVWTAGMCFTWPNLEALVSDKEEPARLPNTIGIYNVVWSGCNALAYFFGGALAESAGWKSIFWLPVLLHIVQLGIGIYLEPRWKEICQHAAAQPADLLHESHPDGPLFLKMAWVANPFAYIAINATIPIIPDLALRLHLSPQYAGFFCSIWFFARMFTFVVLALWEGWHYRFRFLVFACAGLIACFVLILVLNHLWLIVLVQIIFGWCVGLIYYSSLYYSMHVGDTKGEHGGAHEAAIGAGIFGGPFIGAASLYLFPASRQSNVYGVAAVLAIGFAVLLVLGRKRGQARLRATE
jgi:predicted MFS family arabinose efflux permease